MSIVGVPPHSLDAEQAVLGGLMLSPDALDKIAGWLKTEDFYRPDHRVIFAAICDLAERGQPCDAVTMGDVFASNGQAAKVGGADYLTKLAMATPSAANIVAYAKIVREKSQRRKLIDTCTQVIAGVYDSEDEAPALVDAAIGGMMRLQRTDRGAESTIKQAVQQAWDSACEAHAAGGVLTGLSTGLRSLDDHFGGFHPSDLTVIGGRPSMGKTAMLFGMAAHACLAEAPVGIVSAEMSTQQLGLRMLSARSRVSGINIRKARVSDAEWPRLSSAVAELSKLRAWILDRPSPHIAEVMRLARQWKRQHGIQALYVDYLQRLVGRGERRYEQVSDVCVGLKNIARELNIPVIALGQVKREVELRNDKRPGMADFCDSGEIEKEADNILTIYRDEYYDRQSRDAGTAEIIICKSRHGPQAVCRLAWLGESTQFCDLDPAWTPLPPLPETEHRARKSRVMERPGASGFQADA